MTRAGAHRDRPERPVALRDRRAGLRARHHRGAIFRFRSAWRVAGCGRWWSCRSWWTARRRVRRAGGGAARRPGIQQRPSASSCASCAITWRWRPTRRSCTPRCSRPTKTCAARRMPCSSRSGCARWGRWRAASRTTSTTRSRRSPCTSKRLLEHETGFSDARAQATRRSCGAPSTTSRTPWRAWASSTGGEPAQTRAGAGASGARVARGARAHARALERHGAATRRVHRDRDRERWRTIRPSWPSRANCARRWSISCSMPSTPCPKAARSHCAPGTIRAPARISRPRVHRGIRHRRRAWTRTRAAAASSRSSPPRASAARAWAWPWCTASRSGTSMDIDIVSAPGAGTTFRLTFPPATPAARPRPAARMPEDPGPHAHPAHRRRSVAAHITARRAGARRPRSARPPAVARRASRPSSPRRRRAAFSGGASRTWACRMSTAGRWQRPSPRPRPRRPSSC